MVFVSRTAINGAIFAAVMLIHANAWEARAESIRLDLELPGTARSFVRLWTVGENTQTAGLATDPAGRIFTTVSKDVRALAPDGSEFWTFDCSALGGCNTVSTNFDAVFAGLSSVGVARVSNVSGAVECVYQPDDLGMTLTPQRLLATDSYVVIGSTTAASCAGTAGKNCSGLS